MLVIKETISLNDALEMVKKTHKLNDFPQEYHEVYRPFWLGRALFSGRKGRNKVQDGTVLFWADARILQWAILGAYQHRKITTFNELKKYQINMDLENITPSKDVRILEPILSVEQIPTHSKLLKSRRLLALGLKMYGIHFEPEIEYQLVYRPYWEIKFYNRKGKEEFALISRDELLIRN